MENNRQRTVIVAIVALMIVGVIGTTIAYFTSETVFRNQFKTPAHESEFTEEFSSPENWLPGDEEKKEVSVKNTGEYDIAVRISYTEEWIGGDGVTQLPLVQDQDGTEVRAAIINFPNKEDWGKRTEDDGVTYYYYKDILGKDESTSLFMDKVTFNKDITHDETCTNIYTYSDGTTSSGSAPEEGKTVKSTTQRCESTGQTYAGGTYILTIKIETIQWDQYKNGWNIDEDLKDLEWDKTIAGIMKKDAIIDNVASKNVLSESGINFAEKGGNAWNRPTGTYYNGNGIYLRAGTENDEYPIYYYRGEVKDNNVLFAGHCWLIVRTTDTGGVKIVYNGVPVGENKNQCSTYEKDIGRTRYNADFGDAKYIGYTYDINTDSTVKTYIDEWYEKNILDKYDSYLEDTVWCNDRSIVRTANVSGTNITYYGAYGRLFESRNPSVICPRAADKYTVKETSPMYNASLKGNKLLDYPVALLTADELVLAGSPADVNENNQSNDFYLSMIGSKWILSMSPYYSKIPDSAVSYIFLTNAAGNVYVHNSYGTGDIRPVVSLKKGTQISSGEGTAEKPYIVG